MLLATLKKIRKEGPDRNPKDPSTDDESCRHAQPVQGRGGGGERRESPGAKRTLTGEQLVKESPPL